MESGTANSSTGPLRDSLGGDPLGCFRTESTPGERSWQRWCCAVSLPQHPMQNLSGCSSGHLFLVDECDGLRALVASNLGPAPRKQLVFSCALPIPQHDHGMHRFAPYVVRDADD